MTNVAALRARAARIDADYEKRERRADLIFFLRSQAVGFRRLADSWRACAELLRAELCALRAERLDAEADRMEESK